MNSRKKFLKQVEVLKTIQKSDAWESLSGKQRKVFEDEDLRFFMSVIYSSKCFFCKKGFDSPLYNHGWNGHFLFHLKSTHGYDPETMTSMIYALYDREFREKAKTL